jgi:heme-degrading monooxygenase HmoA
VHARSTTISGDPGSVDTGIAFVREESMPALRRMDGCVGLSMLADRESGRCIVTTSWEDAAAVRSSRDVVRPTLERTAEALGGRAEVEEWQIAAMHRVHEAHHGACARVTWLRTAPDGVGKAVDAVRLSLMPKLDDLPGFCSLSVMVRPEDGTTVAAVAYDTWDDLRAAAEGAREFREEFAPSMGIEVLDSADFDLALAHLGVPETI